MKFAARPCKRSDTKIDVNSKKRRIVLELHGKNTQKKDKTL